MALIHKAQAVCNTGNGFMGVGQHVFRDFDFFHQYIPHGRHMEILFKNPAKMIGADIKLFCKVSKGGFIVNIVVNIVNCLIHKFCLGIYLQQNVFLTYRLKNGENNAINGFGN